MATIGTSYLSLVIGQCVGRDDFGELALLRIAVLVWLRGYEVAVAVSRMPCIEHNNVSCFCCSLFRPAFFGEMRTTNV